MVLNKRGGNKSKKQKSAGAKTGGRPLRLKDPQPDSSELYGRVTKRNGGNPPIIQVMCEDGVERSCVVRGKMRNRVWMNPNDFKKDYRSMHGAGFSIAPIFSQSAWFRYHNKDPQIKNLYFAAAGSHPGAGIPGVLCSAKIVEKVIKEDFKLN